MQAPYAVMVMVYAIVAALAAIDAALTSYTLIPPIIGLPWLRVHFITLGVMTQLLFGVLPTLFAHASGERRPAVRWDIWVALNVGFPILLVGIPLISQPVIFTGGSLVLLAAVLLLHQLAGLKSERPQAGSSAGERLSSGQGRKFYLAGLGYLCLGIFIGTGLWLGWTAPLGMAAPKEVHIHANSWGFMSLVFAGLLIDVYPEFAMRSLAWPRSVTPILWLMVLGAFGLVAGPWLDVRLLTAPGMLLHLLATILLLLNVFRPLVGAGARWSAGVWHLALGYIWIVAPLFAAPFILMGVAGFPGATVEQNAPQALIYGWVLQFGYAMGPFLLRRALRPGAPNALGGNLWSVLTVNVGCVLLWTSIFVAGAYGLLHGTAYVLWAASLLPLVRQLWQIVTQETQEGMALDPVREPAG